MREEQAIFNLEIKKKSGLSINPNIHHSKVFSSGGFILSWILILKLYSKLLGTNKSNNSLKLLFINHFLG